MSKELVTNRKAHFEYELIEHFEAGIALKGTEIKSLRDHGGNLQEAYGLVEEKEVWLHQLHIAPYRFGNIFNHSERRKRKLLLHRKEIDKIFTRVTAKGCALIPLAIILVHGLAKVRMALAIGKKGFDKRQTIRKRQDLREMSAALKRG